MVRRRSSRQDEIAKIAGHLIRRHTTAAVLFHHSLAERLGLGPTDLKCFDLLREHGAMSGSELAALTGLTTGAVTGVVARLEDAGFVRRAPDPSDGRKQVLTAITDASHAIHGTFKRVHGAVADVLSGFDAAQLSAISEFLSRSAEVLYREITLMRAEDALPKPAVARPTKGARR